MTLHTYNPQPMYILRINFLHLTVSEIDPLQDIIGKVTTARSKQGHTMTLHTYKP